MENMWIGSVFNAGAASVRENLWWHTTQKIKVTFWIGIDLGKDPAWRGDVWVVLLQQNLPGKKLVAHNTETERVIFGRSLHTTEKLEAKPLSSNANEIAWLG